jgi:hypothetical protein
MTPKTESIFVTRMFFDDELPVFLRGSGTADVVLSDGHNLGFVPTSMNDVSGPFANQSPREW